MLYLLQIKDSCDDTTFDWEVLRVNDASEVREACAQHMLNRFGPEAEDTSHWDLYAYPLTEPETDVGVFRVGKRREVAFKRAAARLRSEKKQRRRTGP